MNTSFLIVLILLATVVSVRLLTDAMARRRATHLIDSSVEDVDAGRAPDSTEDRLGAWLSRSGFRDSSAKSLFWGATAGAAALGLLLAFVLDKLHVVRSMVQILSAIPGGMGDAMAFVASGTPYILLVFLIAAPALYVRAARRNRIESIDQDMAPTLELLATLAEAGLGFDSAIERVRESDASSRPLTQEWRVYQRDVLAGISRQESLRRLAARTSVPAVSIFVSALIQAELVGASLAETLRAQADDLRDRRKLRALLLAQALPVKLVFPLMGCFLPGIFYATLGPVISQFVDVADTVIHRR